MPNPRTRNLFSLGRPAGLLAAALTMGVFATTSAWAAGGSSAPSVPSEPPPSPQATAEDYYNQGLKYRDKAWEFEKKASGASGKAAEKLGNKARKEYQKAVKAQRSAVSEDPMLYQAHSSLGYALRKIGEWDESIAAYDQALAIAPSYPEAIEYRAEAFLGLNRLEDAKEAYLLLMREDQARADELMTAMKKWLERAKGGSEVSASDLDAFASWVEERADLAVHAVMVERSSERDW